MNENQPIFEGLSPIDDAPPRAKRLRLPRICLVFYAYFLLSLALFVVCVCSPAFADGFNRTVSAAIRAVLSYLTGWIPFSLAEYLLLLSPLLLFLIVRFSMKRFSASWREVGRFCLALVSVLALVGAIFLSSFAPAYHTSTLDKKLELEKREVSADELYQTAEILLVAMEKELSDISFATSGFSVMPYGLDEMNDLLMHAFANASDEYDFLPRLQSRTKPVMLSDAMSYTHITGVYSFFTGEANLNVAFPDYTLPYTAAHELAHQRGIAREDEANFMAFLVCIASDDAYIRYCGYRNLYDHVISALYEASPDYYAAAMQNAPRAVTREMVAYSRFFDKYRDAAVADVSETVNNTFLTIQGTEGTKSYGMVVDLAVAYYRTEH